MTITISQQAHKELWQEAEETTPLITAKEQSNQWDCIYQYPPTLGQGLIRGIRLREGIWLWIKDYQLHDDFVVGDSDYFQGLGYAFFYKGNTSIMTCRMKLGSILFAVVETKRQPFVRNLPSSDFCELM